MHISIYVFDQFSLNFQFYSQISAFLWLFLPDTPCHIPLSFCGGLCRGCFYGKSLFFCLSLFFFLHISRPCKMGKWKRQSQMWFTMQFSMQFYSLLWISNKKRLEWLKWEWVYEDEKITYNKMLKMQKVCLNNRS